MATLRKSLRLYALSLGTAIGAAAACFAQVAPSLVDAHIIFEQSCMKCHSLHGADLARQMLKLDAGQLKIARTNAPLTVALKRHHGVKLSEAEVAALAGLFTAGIQHKGAFQHRCALCHGRAVDFAREKLTIKDGALQTRSSGTDVATFLRSHQEATPEEITSILTMLRANTLREK